MYDPSQTGKVGIREAVSGATPIGLAKCHTRAGVVPRMDHTMLRHQDSAIP